MQIRMGGVATMVCMKRRLASSFVLVVACTPADSGSKADSGAKTGESVAEPSKPERSLHPPEIHIDHRGQCEKRVDYRCKPGRTCNPPPPRKVPCPPGMREKWLSEIEVAPNGKCTHNGSLIFCPEDLELEPEGTPEVGEPSRGTADGS